MQRTYGTGNPSVGLVSYINPVYNTSGFMIGYYYEIIDGIWDHFQYIYSDLEIIWTYFSDESDECETRNYSLSQGLSRSCKTNSYNEYGTLKYCEDTCFLSDLQNRLIQIYHCKNRNELGNETYYDYKYDNQGNVIEERASYVIGKGKGLSYLKYEYWTNIAFLPQLCISHPLLCHANSNYVDPILMVQGFFGNSFSKKLLKSEEQNAYDRDSGHNLKAFRYELDEYGRIWGYEVINEGLFGDDTNSYILEWK